ncbi:PREDICTED: killer cell lectin-like receptor 5-like [Elephantulus edwardii]|uniref:killer cell lectin-like receptor 5-like n=1 Tax=Elephantulus edwardii TaxID=28737 RepID=UPI0003F0600E|nr:PREDICTED: killer cell lectin-like receptor 5-like [Elephantulus edwardii]
MSDQEVTYSALRFLQSSSESQNKVRSAGTQGPGETGQKEFSVPWRLTAITLGVLSLFLLMTVAVLGSMVFQHIQEKHYQEEILRNLSQNCHNMQNDSYMKEQKKVDSLVVKKNRCRLEEYRWSCCGINCYYFTTEHNTWKGCLQICQHYQSTLLKIDDEEEKVFIQSQAYKDIFWIGLSYHEKEKDWKWVDSSKSSNYNFTEKGHCAFLSSTRITSMDCFETYNCICKKKIDCIF